jgi:glycosyltransferase involved in cell wall biosynthesis
MKQAVMEKKHDLLIVIPAHNEENNLPQLFDSLRKNQVNEIADMLIVDDASTDSTAAIAGENSAECISLIYNLGYGNALQMGYKYAAENGYDYLIQMDADLQHDPCNIAVIYDRLKTPCEDGIMPDIVLGSRFMKGSGEYRPGVLKKLGFRWFRFLFRLLGGGELADATTGLQGLSRRAFGHYAGFDNFDAKYPDANMILEMKLLDYRVLQVPAVMHTRADGKGMHAGMWKPIKYAVRSTIAVVIARMRVRARK